MLSAKEISSYQEEGYLGPLDLLTNAESEEILNEFDVCIKDHAYLGPNKDKNYDIKQYWQDLGPNVHWFKSLHLLMPSIRKLALNPVLLDMVEPVLGKDIMLWGSQIIRKGPGEDHKWHVDVETLDWDSINVWISLKNTSEKATVKIISRSHTFDYTPQQLEKEDSLDLKDNKKVLSRAQQENTGAELHIPSPNEGQVILFHGKTWHGSFNISDQERTSILMQYSSPRSKVKIPTTFSNPIIWHDYAPPCIMVRGMDRYQLNNYIS